MYVSYMYILYLQVKTACDQIKGSLFRSCLLMVVCSFSLVICSVLHGGGIQLLIIRGTHLANCIDLIALD